MASTDYAAVQYDARQFLVVAVSIAVAAPFAIQQSPVQNERTLDALRCSMKVMIDETLLDRYCYGRGRAIGRIPRHVREHRRRGYAVHCLIQLVSYTSNFIHHQRLHIDTGGD